MRFTKGFLPLSGDPVTYGHLDLISRASKLCETLVLLVLSSDSKQDRYLFAQSERMAMLSRLLEETPPSGNTQVRSYAGPLPLALLREGYEADISRFAIFRGVRNAADRELDEASMLEHSLILPGLDSTVVYLQASPDYLGLSSTLVKSMVYHGLDVSRLVPRFVKRMLEERLCQQYRLGFTGQIASGKSYVAAQLSDCLRSVYGIEVSCVRLDDLEKRFLEEDSPSAEIVRSLLGRLLGPEVLDPDGSKIDSHKVAERIFDSSFPEDNRRLIHEAMAPQIARLLAESLSGKRGLVLIEWALLAENGLTHLTNDNVVLVHSPSREEFCQMRGLAPAKVSVIDRNQWSYQVKFALLRQKAEEHGGVLVRFENTFENSPEFSELQRASVSQLAEAVLSIFPGLCPVPDSN